MSKVCLMTHAYVKGYNKTAFKIHEYKEGVYLGYVRLFFIETCLKHCCFYLYFHKAQRTQL